MGSVEHEVHTMTPRLVELVRADLEWIRKVADAQYEGDPKLRSDAARTLIRISDRASEAISRLMAEGGLVGAGATPLEEVRGGEWAILKASMEKFGLTYIGAPPTGKTRDESLMLAAMSAMRDWALLQASEVKRLLPPPNP